MTTLLLKLPWFVAAPLVAAVAGVFALAGYMFTGDYFHETCKNERNLLTGEFEPSNCGEGAQIARALEPATGGTTGVSGSPASTAAAASGTAAQSPAASATPSPATTPASSSPTAVASTAAATPTNPPVTPTPAAVATPTPAAAATPTPTRAAAQAGVLAKGNFRDGAPGHTGRGRVEIQRLPDGSLNLLLADFSVTNGPDLYVVLSRGKDGSYGGNDLQLARLKANNGTQNYAIPAGTDVSGFESVLIWCKAFDVVFAYAPLAAAQ